MRGFSSAVIALDHHAAIIGKACEDRERGLAVETICRIELGHPIGCLGKSLDDHVGVDPEGLPNRDIDRRPFDFAWLLPTIHDCTLRSALPACCWNIVRLFASPRGTGCERKLSCGSFPRCVARNHSLLLNLGRWRSWPYAHGIVSS